MVKESTKTSTASTIPTPLADYFIDLLKDTSYVRFNHRAGFEVKKPSNMGMIRDL
jgi:hypothetical protein